MVVSIQSSQKRQPSATDNAIQEISSAKICLSAASRLQLLTELQSTLDMDSLLGIFLRHLNEYIAVDGLYFTEDSRRLTVKIGKQSMHSCGYRLLDETRDKGEIVLKRSKRFSSSELELIESLVVCLLTPITNSLQYIDTVKAAVSGSTHGRAGELASKDSLYREIELAKRHNYTLSIILVQISAGSSFSIEAIGIKLIEGVRQASRNTDRLFQTGSNCFALLLHRASDSNTTAIIDRLRSDLDSALSQDDKAQLAFGTATLTGTDTMNSLLDRAAKGIFQN